MSKRTFSQALEQYLDIREEEAESRSQGDCYIEPYDARSKRYKQMKILLEDMDSILAKRGSE